MSEPVDDIDLTGPALLKRCEEVLAKGGWVPPLLTACKQEIERLRMDLEHAVARDWLGCADAVPKAALRQILDAEVPKCN